MGANNWFLRMKHAINNEYERRIRAASLVTEYGQGHGHDHDHHASHPEAHPPDAPEDAADGAVITNVPRGATMRGSRRARTTSATPPEEQPADQAHAHQD